MKPRTEELLYFLLWSADSLMRPTWRNLNDPFETWAWRNGLGRRLAELERQKLIESHPDSDVSRIVRLTDAGRCLALGGRDPARRWSRGWDGQWRLVMFDLPGHRHELRQQLWRTLRRHHFGYLQMSVWITPDPATELRVTLGETKVQADAFLVIEGRPAAGESDQEIVQAAWDFPRINHRYERHRDFLRHDPPTDGRLVEWARREIAGWRAAVALDPLLPRPLLPSGYLGIEVWQRRQKILARLAGLVGKPPVL
jgi:phenylacetic acid degradation operon negative regulatory protein